jgi:hypothetical protein
MSDQIVSRSSSSGATRTDDYPPPSIGQQAERAASDILAAHAGLFDPERASRRGADLAANVAQAEALLRTSGLAGREQLEAFCRPATKAEIGLCLAALVAAFPDGLRADDDSYVCALEPEIWGLQPSLGAINAGCRKIKIEFKPQWGRRVPTVSEVVAAVQKAGALFECARSAHSELPERIAVAKRTLAARDIKEQRAR